MAVQITELPAGARAYRKKIRVYAFAADAPVTYLKSWGTQEMSARDFVIISADGDDTEGYDVYGCARREFFEMYEAVPGETHLYRKKTGVQAVQMSEPFELETRLREAEKAEVEDARGQAGDYVVQQTGGELMAVPKARFEAAYELA